MMLRRFIQAVVIVTSMASSTVCHSAPLTRDSIGADYVRASPKERAIWLFNLVIALELEKPTAAAFYVSQCLDAALLDEGRDTSLARKQDLKFSMAFCATSFQFDGKPKNGRK
jgi:hypothetical protein